MFEHCRIELLGPELAHALLAHVGIYVVRVVAQTAAALANENGLTTVMLLAFVFGPAAEFIRLFAGTAAQLVLAVLAHLAGVWAPDPIVQQVLIKSEAAECLEALRALVPLALSRRKASLCAARAYEIPPNRTF